MNNKLLPNFILSVVALLAFANFSGCASSQPNPALDLGGMDLEAAFSGAIQRVGQILNEIDSIETAEKANDELALISMGMDDLLFNSQKLSMDGQTALSMVALKESQNMQDMMAQVSAQPAINNVVGGTMQDILAKIKQLI